jgi:hypothetical protein
MTEPDCTLCRDERWICEEHPDQPMRHDGCRGAGVPCPDCNPAGGPDEPPAPPRGFRSREVVTMLSLIDRPFRAAELKPA